MFTLHEKEHPTPPGSEMFLPETICPQPGVLTWAGAWPAGLGRAGHCLGARLSLLLAEKSSLYLAVNLTDPPLGLFAP